MENLKSNPYFLGITATVVMFVSLSFLKSILVNRAEKFKHDVLAIYVLSHTTTLFMLVSSLYVGFQFLPQHKIYTTLSWRIFFAALMIQFGIWGSFAIKKRMQLAFSRRYKRDPASASSINILELMLKVSFLSLLILFTLHNMGIQVATMITGLGVGGIAIALAIQNILGDLFSSLSIILDKPFVVGDFIIIDEWMGEVEYIGLKTTRIRSLHGEQIIISNSDLLRSRIRNMKRMHERRNNLQFALPHESSPQRIKQVVEIITAVICSKNELRFERCHYYKVTSTALEIEVVYFILSNNHQLHMDLQQTILLEIHQIFLQEGIIYASPIQKMQLLNKVPLEQQASAQIQS